MTAGRPTDTPTKGNAVSTPNIDDIPEMGIYVATSAMAKGDPKVVLTERGVLHINFPGSYAPYLSMTLDGFRRLNTLVNEAVEAAGVAS